MYQGRIAAYLAVKKINDLYKSGNECEIKNYKLEMEKCEDIAIICDDGMVGNINQFIRLRMKKRIQLKHIKIH